MIDRVVPVEILVQGKQRVGFQFPEHASELLLDPIDRMEEVSPVYARLARAQLPIRSEQKVPTEQLVFEIGESPAGDQGEVGDIFFVLPAPCAGPRLTRVGLNRGTAQMLFLGDAFDEPVIANPENRA